MTKPPVSISHRLRYRWLTSIRVRYSSIGAQAISTETPFASSPESPGSSAPSSSGLIIPGELGAFICQTEGPRQGSTGSWQGPRSHRVSLRGRCRAGSRGEHRFPQQRWHTGTLLLPQRPARGPARWVSKNKYPLQNSIRKHSTQQKLFNLNV